MQRDLQIHMPPTHPVASSFSGVARRPCKETPIAFLPIQSTEVKEGNSFTNPTEAGERRSVSWEGAHGNAQKGFRPFEISKPGPQACLPPPCARVGAS